MKFSNQWLLLWKLAHVCFFCVVDMVTFTVYVQLSVVSTWAAHRCYLYIYLYIYIYIYIYVCVYINIYVNIYVCVCVHLFVYFYVCATKMVPDVAAKLSKGDVGGTNI